MTALPRALAYPVEFSWRAPCRNCRIGPGLPLEALNGHPKVSGWLSDRLRSLLFTSARIGADNDGLFSDVLDGGGLRDYINLCNARRSCLYRLYRFATDSLRRTYLSEKSELLAWLIKMCWNHRGSASRWIGSMMHVCSRKLCYGGLGNKAF